MIKIGDLIKSLNRGQSGQQCATQEGLLCDIVVDRDSYVYEVLTRMQQEGCNVVGVEREDGLVEVLSREQIVEILLREIESLQNKLTEAHQKASAEFLKELDEFKENAVEMAHAENNILEMAVNYMTEGMIITDKQGKIIKGNPSAKQMLGLKADDNLQKLQIEFDHYGFTELMRSSTKGDSSWGLFNLKSPADRTLQVRWTEMIDQSGQSIANLFVIRDITNELAGEKAKSEFIAAITHELRTPVTIIRNAVSNILAGVTGRINGKLRAYLETMENDCKRFGNLINDLLDMSKLEAGTMPISREVVNVEKLIARAVNEFSRDAKSAGIKLSSEIDGYISPLLADPGRIYQVLSNLVSNALKFTPEGGSIRIGAYEKQNEVTVWVEDTGIGISEVLGRQIFNKFYQIGRKAGAGYNGAGLGLAISHGIVAAHGGKIWFESEEGKGSTFFFSIPVGNPSTVLNKHLDNLGKQCKGKGTCFGLIVVKFDSEDAETKGQYKEVIGSTIFELLCKCKKVLKGKDDVAFKVGNFESIFVVCSAKSAEIQNVKRKIEKIIRNELTINFSEIKFVPIMGMSIYPCDAEDVIELERVARQKAEKLL